jgi:[acyl-carrier-protein] S-malonyltransferase
MSLALVFPGQGSQFPGMAKDLYDNHASVKEMLEKANDILGFRITDTMFDGSAEDLKQTNITQPAIFLHSIAAHSIREGEAPSLVAGHSLGEFSALVANQALAWEDALVLVSKRAEAMQKACEAKPSTMAAVLALADEEVERICAETDGIVVAANYNCPGQLVISGEVDAVNAACAKMKEAGAKRALVLPVGGAFHSPLMQPAREELAEAIAATHFAQTICPVVQNATATIESDPEVIKKNLIDQLTAPVRWTQSVQVMVNAGITLFEEVGPGKVLQGLVKKIAPDVTVS